MMFFGLVFLIVLQRLWELQIAASNVANLKRRGAVEFGGEHYPLMVLLHGGWLFATVCEARSGLSLASAGKVLAAGWLLLVAGQLLRWWTIRTLGRRWTTRILILPGAELVTGGPFRWFKHPNYLGVCLEIVGLPLVGGCWRTACVFGLLNIFLLRRRIAIENEALKAGPIMEVL